MSACAGHDIKKNTNTHETIVVSDSFVWVYADESGHFQMECDFVRGVDVSEQSNNICPSGEIRVGGENGHGVTSEFPGLPPTQRLIDTCRYVVHIGSIFNLGEGRRGKRERVWGKPGIHFDVHIRVTIQSRMEGGVASAYTCMYVYMSATKSV